MGQYAQLNGEAGREASVLEYSQHVKEVNHGRKMVGEWGCRIDLLSLKECQHGLTMESILQATVNFRLLSGM